MEQEKIWVIVSTVIVTAMLAGGIVYAMQKNRVNDLQDQMKILGEKISLMEEEENDIEEINDEDYLEDLNIEGNIEEYSKINIPLIELEGGTKKFGNDYNDRIEASKIGEYIGCGDSIFYFEKEIKSTTQPLTAIYQELFTMENSVIVNNKEYINPINYHQVNLNFEKAVVENRTAYVYMTGQYISVGACESPRTKGVLEFAAKQYDWIDDVVFYINGEKNNFIHGGPGEDIVANQGAALYQNLEYNYQTIYPEGWYMKENGSDTPGVSKHSIQHTDFSPAKWYADYNSKEFFENVIVWDNPQKLSIENWLKNENVDHPALSGQKITIDGKEAYKYEPEGNCYYIHVWTANENRVYQLTYNEQSVKYEYLEEFDLLLDNFEFME